MGGRLPSDYACKPKRSHGMQFFGNDGFPRVRPDPRRWKVQKYGKSHPNDRMHAFRRQVACAQNATTPHQIVDFFEGARVHAVIFPL